MSRYMLIVDCPIIIIFIEMKQWLRRPFLEEVLVSFAKVWWCPISSYQQVYTLVPDGTTRYLIIVWTFCMAKTQRHVNGCLADNRIRHESLSSLRNRWAKVNSWVCLICIWYRLYHWWCSLIRGCIWNQLNKKSQKSRDMKFWHNIIIQRDLQTQL